MTSYSTWDEHELAGVRILIVEDSEDSAEALEDLLNVVGATVAVAYDGPRAIEVARDFEPDVVLLDLELPGMHGSAVAERLRAQSGPGKDVRIIAVTGYGRHDDARRLGEAQGFFAYFVKPFAFEEILQAIRAR